MEIHADVPRYQESPGRANACKHVSEPFCIPAGFPKDLDTVVGKNQKWTNEGSASGPSAGISWSLGSFDDDEATGAAAVSSLLLSKSFDSGLWFRHLERGEI